MSSNSGLKTKENQESWESVFRKTLSKERLFTFSRPSENPIHWIHFLDPFDQQEACKVSRSAITRDLVDSERTPRSGHVSGEKLSQLKLSEAVVALAQAAAKASGESVGGGLMDVPSWPLIPFSKVQMIKCEKCGLEFSSPMNYRRHLRIVHRRQIHTEKEDLKSQRQQLATFWDNLSPEEAYKIVAVESLGVEDLTGEMVVRALTQSLQQPSFFTLPHAYVKSGSVLLELVKRSSRLLITSSELFKVLDGSSEKTFPSFGLNTMQRYIFEAGAGKVGLETKNLVSSLGFLVELNLVKAFIKDKDEEAWRCQTALVEEEEASQRKRAETQARKHKKKVRRQDSKDKEQKPSDLAMVSDSDMSDDGNSSSSESAIGYGLQSRPSTNTFENLYDRLAGEGSDSDQHLEVVLTAVSSPCENDQMQGNPDDMVGIGDEVVPACEGFGDGVENSSATNDGNLADASGFQKSYIYQKRKYPADRSLSFRGKTLLLPYQKVSSNERDGLSAKKFPKQIMASYLKEDMGSASPCCPKVALGGASVDKVAGFRPRQYVAKPVRIRNYQTTSQTGAAVWAKKVTKCADAASDKVPPCAERADCTSPEIASPVQADGIAGLSAFANLDGRNACSLSSSTTVCPSTESLSLTRGESDSSNQVNVAASKVASLSLVELGHYNNPYEGHNPASAASVVIGSVSVSFVDSMVGQEESALRLSSCMGEAVTRKVVEVPEKNLLCPAARTTQSFGALHENGVINCVLPKELERNGKSFKFPSQLDPEGKENSEHLTTEAAKGSFTKLTAMQGGNFKAPRLKVWRPVVSNASPGNRVENVSASGSNSSDSDRVENVSASGHNTRMVSLNHVDREANLNNFNSRELELGQTEKDRYLANFGHDATPVEENRSIVAEDGSAMPGSDSESGWSSTFEAVSCFLSQRWSNAINSSDSVIVSVEDEEGCVRRSCENIGDVQIEDANVYAKASGKPRPQSNKDTHYLSGNARRIRGVWKQGCSGSAMAANRQLMGKDDLHFNSKFSGYRYVPK